MRNLCAFSNSASAPDQSLSIPSNTPQAEDDDKLSNPPSQVVAEQSLSSPPFQESEFESSPIKIVFKKSGIRTKLTSHGKLLVVYLPFKSKMPILVQQSESLKCSDENCRLLVPWFKRGISRNDLRDHFRNFHVSIPMECILCMPSEFPLV